VSYLACARKLLGALDAVFPQFATHNAYSVAAIHAMAGNDFQVGRYEFQCLHGMGEPLYEEVVGQGKLNRPCRIYAPVGSHETLLAYLVRRLLENGANSSFVNRIQDPAISIEDLIGDPVAAVASRAPVGAPHERIARPRDLFAPGRVNSAGLDLGDEHRLAALASDLMASAEQRWWAAPSDAGDRPARAIHNPADRRDVVGHVVEATAADVNLALERATAASASWGAVSSRSRADCLTRAAELMEARGPALLGLLVREAGKSLPNAVAEVREAVDFLRYYAAHARDGLDPATDAALGAVVCISPWNFPLAIFTGQVAAALVAGNTVLAKPSEETPLVAALAVALLHEAGTPKDALHLLPGGGEVGARLVADPRARGVVFTGSTAVARLIQRKLARRLNPDGRPVPLIAETGGLNAMVVDSSALAEQVVADVMASAFDSAGQRCSALRVLCLQEDGADRILAMLRGAMAELSIGNPDRLSVDIGPVITAEARDGIEAYVRAMGDRGCPVYRVALPEPCRHGAFVAPTLIELKSLDALQREVFGPVLHVVRYRRDALDQLMADIAATGYGLTFGVHTRIDDVARRAVALSRAGNTYVNRNIVGAVVGVQPFGGHGLSGTGPKAGGPFYLRRLLATCPRDMAFEIERLPEPAIAWLDWLESQGETSAAMRLRSEVSTTPHGVKRDLAGPVGERNEYWTEARGAVLCVAADHVEILHQIGAALATGNRALVATGALRGVSERSNALKRWVVETPEAACADIDAVLFSGSGEELEVLARAIAERDGGIVAIHIAQPDGRYPLEWLIQEKTVSTNTTAAGGNAHLMMIG
jgi:RHH-type proline utilization regulon transcriptional repressor/proline dehydrogenase/delta 1-pyrroline-5-carboxylate dehydrogenase